MTALRRCTILLAALSLTVAGGPGADAAEREELREYANVPGLNTCNPDGQAAHRGVGQYLGGDCFRLEAGDTSVRLVLRDDQRVAGAFRWKFVDATGADVTPYANACGTTLDTAIPANATQVHFEFPAGVPASLCPPATTGTMVLAIS